MNLEGLIKSAFDNVTWHRKVWGTNRERRTTLGQNYDGKRGTGTEAHNYGFKVGEAGVLNVSLDTRYQERDNKAGSNGYSSHYYPLADGSPDPREATASHHTYKRYGLPRSQLADAAYNLDLPLNDVVTLYSFSTLATRENNDGQNFRLPSGCNTITTGPNGFPDGYSPYRLVNETDFQSRGRHDQPQNEVRLTSRLETLQQTSLLSGLPTYIGDLLRRFTCTDR